MYNILYIEQSDPKGVVVVVVVDNKEEDKNKKMNDEPEKDQEGKMATCDTYLRQIKKIFSLNKCDVCNA